MGQKRRQEVLVTMNTKTKKITYLCEMPKVQRSNNKRCRDYEHEIVSVIFKSTEEDEQRRIKINKNGYQTPFKAKVSEKSIPK